jgi:hypothetical protein
VVLIMAGGNHFILLMEGMIHPIILMVGKCYLAFLIGDSLIETMT